MSQGSLKSHLLTLGTGMAAGRILAFLQGIVIARLLGPSGFGRYIALISICALLSRVGDFGLPHAFSYFARKTPGSERSLLRVLGINILAGCVLYGLAISAFRFLPVPAFQEFQASAPWTTVVFLFLLVGTLWGLLQVFLMAAGEYRKYVLFANAATLFLIALQYAFYFIQGAGLMSLFAAHLVAQGIMSAILFIYLMRRPRGTEEAVRISARQCYRFGLQVQWGVVMKLAGTKLEVPLISALIPGAAVGHYSLASTCREATLIPQQVYGGIFQNALIDRHKIPGGSAGSLIIRTLLLQACLYAVIALGAWIVFPFAIPFVYGPLYAEAVTPAIILVASSVFTGLAGLCWIGFNTSNRPHLTSMVTTVSGIASPILILAFAATYGLIGVALASLGASILTFALSLGLTIWLNGFSRKDLANAIMEIRHRAGWVKNRTKARQ